MGLDYLKWDSIVKPYIDKCKAESKLCWFTDAAGYHHAAARGSHILKAEIRDKTAKEITRDADLLKGLRNSADSILFACLHFEDGYQYIEAPGKELPTLSHKISHAINRGTDFHHRNLDGSFYDFDGKDLIGYSIGATLTCWCPTNTLAIKGCVSASGRRCPNLRSLKRVQGKNPNP